MSDYEGFADQYDQTFELAPFRKHIEAYSLLKLVGDCAKVAIQLTQHVAHAFQCEEVFAPW